jgi:molybdate transport system substrate-binding protein
LDLIALADPNLAPAGVYSREFLVSTGLWSSLESRFVFAADVRAALNYVRSGNVDAAIVYMTDGLTEPDLLIWDIVPADSYSPISYPAAVIVDGDGDRHRDASMFAEFLVSPEIVDIFHSYGFR